MAYPYDDEPLPSEETTQQQMTGYLEGMMRGQSGRRLAATAGLPIAPPGPEAVSPPPPTRTQWPHTMPAPGTEDTGDYDQVMRSVSGLPIDKAMKAVNAAKQFMAIRGYQKDLEAGKPADETLAKWAPVGLLGDKASLTGAASFLRATQPKPEFAFVPGKEGAPATYQARGQRPVIVPASALPGGSEVTREELVPGSGTYLVSRPGERGFKIATTGGGRRQAVEENARLAARKELAKQIDLLRFMKPGTPSYTAATNYIDALERKAKGMDIMGQPGTEGVTAAPPIAAPAAGVLKKDASTGFPIVTTREEYDALEPNSTYIGRDGKRYKKP